MLQKDIMDQIVFSCDEALKESFLKRMDIALKAAEDIVEKGGGCADVYDAELEKAILEHASFGLTPELTSKARMLWRELLRMSRERQYKYISEIDPAAVLAHEADMCAEGGKKPVLCPVGLEREISAALNDEVSVRASVGAVFNGILAYDDARGAVVADSLYNTEWIYSAIYNKHIYINNICKTPDGSICLLMSQRLVDPRGDAITSIVFSLPEEHGAMAEAIGIFADYKINVEYFRMRNIRDQGSKLKNLIFVDLEADLKSPGLRAALMQLENELPFFRVIGWRKSV